MRAIAALCSLPGLKKKKEKRKEKEKKRRNRQATKNKQTKRHHGPFIYRLTGFGGGEATVFWKTKFDHINKVCSLACQVRGQLP